MTRERLIPKCMYVVQIVTMVRNLVGRQIRQTAFP